MRNFVKIFVFPALAFVLASAGAISSNSSKSSDSDIPPMIAFAHGAGINSCEPQEVNCTTTVLAKRCLSSETTPRPVWLKDGTGACVIDLYRP